MAVKFPEGNYHSHNYSPFKMAHTKKSGGQDIKTSTGIQPFRALQLHTCL